MKKKAFVTIPFCIVLAILIATSLVLISTKPAAPSVLKPQRLAETTKPAVVRIVDYAIVKWTITLDDERVTCVLKKWDYKTELDGFGSGAIINSDGYIVTNAHVLVYSQQLSDKDIVSEAFSFLVDDVATANKWTHKFTDAYLKQYTSYEIFEKGVDVYLPTIDDPISAVVKSYQQPTDHGKDVALLKIDGSNYPTIPLGNSDSILNQDNIWVIGYPAAADSELLSMHSYVIPTMNKGQISAISKTTLAGSPVLQINAASTHGNSGGPIINNKGELIGLLTFRGDTVNDQEVQGFHFAVPVNTMKKVVKKADVHFTESQTDKLFQEGLTFYWSGYYKDALSKFEALQQIYPKHPEVKRYIRESKEKMGSSKTLWADHKTSFYIQDTIACILILILLLYTFMFNSKRQLITKPNPTSSENVSD
ncbi:S1C family serine protease [Gottfriedia acidiceleris]|uniref:S1C family serine protease n=1 Tax=Gottfriedia acidiceleris TaxID=371036 RepID=UPI0014318C47|nr:serine protease [Gottfriedia acidiceleris]